MDINAPNDAWGLNQLTNDSVCVCKPALMHANIKTEVVSARSHGLPSCAGYGSREREKSVWHRGPHGLQGDNVSVLLHNAKSECSFTRVGVQMATKQRLALIFADHAGWICFAAHLTKGLPCLLLLLFIEWVKIQVGNKFSALHLNIWRLTTT